MIIDYLNPLEIKKELARRSLLKFTQYTFPSYIANWHHIVLCDYLEQWIAGDIKRLMVFLPPRTGKSELVSRRLPAYIFGKNPDASIVATSYGADLASRMNRDLQRIIDDEKYKELFPNTGLWSRGITTGPSGALRNVDIFEIMDHKGVYKCAGVGGGITGMGYDFGIIDDPVKDRLEANSTTYRDRVWDWYTSTFYTRRMDDNAKILITMTRWHEDDLAGRLLRLQSSDPEADKWTVVKFPMIAQDSIEGDPREPGEALWPDRFSLDSLITSKINMGSYDWSALMQQNPTPSEGARVKRDWLIGKYVDVPNLKSLNKIAMGVDLAVSEKASADYTACAVLGKNGSGIYVLDVQRMKGTFNEQIKFIKSLADKWTPKVVGVEDVGYQRVMAQQLSLETSLNIMRITVDRDKIARFAPLENRYEQGLVYHVRGLPGAFETELFGFGAGAEHDDQIDAMSCAWAAFGTEDMQIRVPPMAIMGRGIDRRRGGR